MRALKRSHQCISPRPHSQFLYQEVTYLVHTCQCGEKLYEKFPRLRGDPSPRYYRRAR